MEEEEYYDTAQICLNGHMVNFYSDSQSDSNQNFCSDCGAPTIRQCPNLNSIKLLYKLFVVTATIKR